MLSVMNIGAFALATGLSIPALRHYDDIGLLKPVRVDPGTGYRQYDPGQVDRARLICGLRGVGLPIDEIRAVLGRPEPEIRATLDAHRSRLVAQVRELSQRVLAIDEFVERGTAMPPVRAVRPVQLWIGVADVEAAAAFYAAAFDAVVLADIDSVQFGTYRSDRFFLLTFRPGEDRPTRFGLLVDDVDAAHARAVTAGAAEVHPPMEFDFKPRSSCVRDPDGNLIDLTGP